MFAVIMAGGSGTRFWPWSRRQKPKQFLDITGNGPMVVETCDRLGQLSADDEMILVLGQEQLSLARPIFEGRPVHLLAEPVGRNTAPCMGLGAVYAQYLGCRGPVAFLPADHFIGDPGAFVTALRTAGEIADTGGIVTLGIVPSRPETGYGYIRRGEGLAAFGDDKAYGVSEFVEKPDLEKARRYMASGEYYWNGGIFVATPETILNETAALLPDLYEGLSRLKEALGKEQFESELKEVYDAIPAVSFDYGIMEKTKEALYVVPCRCGWSDVGSWASLYELRRGAWDQYGNLEHGETILMGCEESLVSESSGRMVACLGLKKCLVVDTPDALLVADLDRSQDIREIVAELRKQGREKLL